MLKPLILAFFVAVLPIAAESQTQDRAGEGARTAQDFSETAYRRDVARAAELAIEETELTLKFNAGKISADRYTPALQRVRLENDALTNKWEQAVNRRAAVMFTGDVFVKAAPRINELKRQYAPLVTEAPKPKPAPPPYDPYLAAQAQEVDRQQAGESLFSHMGWIFLASFILCVAVALFAGLWRRWFPKPEEPEPPKPATSGIFGTASWATPSPTLRYDAKPSTGVFFGKDSHPDMKAVPLDKQWGTPLCSFPAAHSLIVARTRTGKGTRVIIPTLLRYAGSAVVVDPKGENAAVTAAMRARLHPGKTSPVHIINPWGVLDWHFETLGFPPATFNPLDLIDRKSPGAVSIAQALAHTISPSTGGKDEFWQDSAANVIAAVMLWVVYQPGETATLARVREITTLPRLQFKQKFMDLMVATDAFDGAIRELIGPYVDMAADTYSGIMGNVGKALRFMSDPLLKAATATSTFSIAELRQEPATLYLVIPLGQIPTKRTWLRLVIAGITQFYRAAADDPKERPPAHRCMMLIDEFPALGRMPDMPTDIATMAGYGIDYTLVVQGLDQLRDAYDKGRRIVRRARSFARAAWPRRSALFASFISTSPDRIRGPAYRPLREVAGPKSVFRSVFLYPTGKCQ